MSQVELYIAELEPPKRQIMSVLHNLIMSQLRLDAKIRYKIPFYYNKSWICYLNPIKKGGVELCFLRSNELSNEQGLLDFKDRKQVAGISYFSVDEIDKNSPLPILHEAQLLDETVKYAAKRKN